jgi:hypothetical protein
MQKTGPFIIDSASIKYSWFFALKQHFRFSTFVASVSDIPIPGPIKKPTQGFASLPSALEIENSRNATAFRSLSNPSMYCILYAFETFGFLIEKLTLLGLT